MKKTPCLLNVDQGAWRRCLDAERRVNSKWFFSDSRCLRCRVVQEGDLAVSGIGIGRRRGVEKGGTLLWFRL